VLEATGRWEFHRLPLHAWYTPFALFSMLWLVLMFYPKGFTPFIYSQF
jgi:alkyl hydroperoxide reductase subunit AhpC